MEINQHHNLDCVEISNKTLSLLVSRAVGPRILSLRVNGGENILAELPGVTIDSPGQEPFHFYGGHRLWLAPEQPDPTYLSDDDPVDITLTETGCQVVQPVDERSGLQKTLEITLDQKKARVEILHRITNHTEDPITGALWAITQFKLGGHALMPLNNSLTNDNPTLPNRSIILWPYTDFNNPSIPWGNEHVAIHAQTDEPLKIGTVSQRGWLAYWIKGALFVKHAAYKPDAEYWGYGSTLECYCNHQFLELETLAPLTTLQPGESGYHTETWHILPDVEWDKNIHNTVNLIESHLQTV